MPTEKRTLSIKRPPLEDRCREAEATLAKLREPDEAAMEHRLRGEAQDHQMRKRRAERAAQGGRLDKARRNFPAKN